MELSVYKRQIAFGSAASVAFLAAGVFAAGTAYASTTVTLPTGSVAQAAAAAPAMGTASPSALVSSLPSLSQVRGTLANGVAPAARGLGSRVQGLAGQVTSGNPASSTLMSTPMQSAPALAPVSFALPGMGAASGLLGTVTGAAKQVPGMQGATDTVGTPQTGVNQLPGTSLGSNVVGQVAHSVNPGKVSGSLSGLTGSAGLSGVTGKVGSAASGVTGAVNGSGVNGNLPVG